MRVSGSVSGAWLLDELVCCLESAEGGGDNGVNEEPSDGEDKGDETRGLVDGRLALDLEGLDMSSVARMSASCLSISLGGGGS